MINLSELTGGTFFGGRYGMSDGTIVNYKNWEISFDYYDLYSGKFNQRFTRVFVPITSKDNFRFEIYNNGIIRSVEKLFGAQDVEIGIKGFDKKFILKANNEFKLKKLLQNPNLRSLIEKESEFNFQISNYKGIWEEKTENLELSFFVQGEIKSMEKLNSLLDIFKITLENLEENHSITKPAANHR
ncbi:hypothetical protein HUK80_14095 [Flavobacterium sp. MAH-1]|uniref:DUF3137 domain-containing protein n=1 Tax=Flavobacterium agri TaxID=2743471 RepID=A0A7Y8Y3V8_9FLAO|nr:hypothetical protein [Flavobacterium agri]NUY82032.1 hypothetical protein [Flavobacterium agri]NYA72056.1 hypothetical protein [Flavobacterium agri]